jgi:predicted PurR-regulated permease PerM
MFRHVLAVLAAVLLAAVLWVGYKIILIMLMAILVASALRPLIQWLQQRWRLSQNLAVLLVYLVVGGIGLAVLAAVGPPMLNRFALYLQNEYLLSARILAGAAYIESVLTQLTGSPVQLGLDPEQVRAGVDAFLLELNTSAPTMVNTALTYTGAFLLVLVMGWYWITSRDTALQFLTSLVPLSQRARMEAIVEEIELTLGAYLRGILSISLIVGSLSFVPLMLMGIPNALVISFLYGAATTVPVVGGFIGVVLATTVGLLTSPTAAVKVLIVTVALQQFEEYILSPRVMARSVEFNPILVITFISMGFALNGLTGALLAVPVAGSLAILLKYLVLEPRRQVVAETPKAGVLIVPLKTNGASGD